ncbi:MAG TPA: holo-ACP synthase [Baekduia sp.]|nr:holo-ACP synthase [Baekduia sp.]
MPLRVGTDLVLATAVREALEAHGERYLQRVYTAAETADCTDAATGEVDALRLAARFAAKEAAMKALRVGEAAVPWTAIEVRRSPDGHPELVLHGPAADLAARAGMTELAVSLTHEEPYASAVVVAELHPTPIKNA